MKEAYYFSHDSNARNDPKIVAMLTKYQWFGYGMYWAIIEIMREQDNYKLESNKYTCSSLAMQLHTDAKQVEDFLKDCIEEYELFEEKNNFIYSKSLLRRMKKKDELSKKRSKAASQRWNKNKDLTGDKLQGKSNAIALQKQCNKSKGKEKKEKGNTIIQKPENVSEQTWNDFLAHRKTKKANVTQTVLNTFIKQAGIAGISLEDALIETVSRGWTGFKAEWIKSNQEQSTTMTAIPGAIRV
jgi:hypothetical protein